MFFIMKTVKKIKLVEVSSKSIQKKDLGKLKGGICSSYDCQCGGTFSTSMTDAVLEDDSHR